MKTAKGGVFTSRGKIFLRVTVALNKRKSVVLSWCDDPGVALERAKFVQSLVDRAMAQGQDDLVPKIVEAAGEPGIDKLRALDDVVGFCVDERPSMTLPERLREAADDVNSAVALAHSICKAQFSDGFDASDVLEVFRAILREAERREAK